MQMSTPSAATVVMPTIEKEGKMMTPKEHDFQGTPIKAPLVEGD